MEYFRRFLTFLRKNYNTRRKQYFILWGSILLISTVAGVLVDTLVPFGAWWNLIRTVVLVPLSVSMFAVGYGVSLLLHYIRKTDPSWVPYRYRFSPMWRRRISAIVGAAAFLLVYASNGSFVFTFFSASLLAIVLSLVAFMRQTTQEMKREQLGIPDSRDVSYDSEVKRLQNKRKQAAAKKEEEKQSKKSSNGKFRMFRPMASSTQEDNS